VTRVTQPALIGGPGRLFGVEEEGEVGLAGFGADGVESLGGVRQLLEFALAERRHHSTT
jgi:hypothetical protein